MKRNSGVLKAVLVFMAIFFFTAGQIAYAAGPGINLTGQAQGAGTAEMRTNSGWIGISDKAYPLASGSELVTGNGEITVTLKNGARIEAGKNTQISVWYSNSTYSVQVQRGTMAYDVPQSARISINTANAKMTSYALSKGFIGVGKDTYIQCRAGKVAVSGPAGNTKETVKAGETFRAARANGTYTLTPVAYNQSEIQFAITSSPAVVADASAGATATDAAVTSGTGWGLSTTTGLIIGSVVVGGAVAAVVETSGGSSSPY